MIHPVWLLTEALPTHTDYCVRDEDTISVPDDGLCRVFRAEKTKAQIIDKCIYSSGYLGVM